MLSCCRPALFLCQTDGTLAILGVEGTTLAGKPVWMQPKNRSQAVSMMLLGADGAPLYPKDTHLHLTWPHNNMISLQFQDDLPGGLTAVSCFKSSHKLVIVSNHSALCCITG